jgi:hypothetical protein
MHRSNPAAGQPATPRTVCNCFSNGVAQDLTGRVRQCAIEVRDTGVRAEDLVVAIREAWHGLPESRGWLPARKALLPDLINTALEAYYQEQASGPAPD